MPAIRTQRHHEGAYKPSEAPRRSTRARNVVSSYSETFPSRASSDTEDSTVSANVRPHSGRTIQSRTHRGRSTETPLSSNTDDFSEEGVDFGLPSASSRHGETIVVDGITLRPTIAFDTFWRFAAERKAIDDRRRAGEPTPWTSDHILKKYFFCNTYRVLDKTSQFMVQEVIEKGPQTLLETVFRVILFNLFTRIETWQLLDKALGPLTWAKFNLEKYKSVLDAAADDRVPLYTSGFIKPAPKWFKDRNHVNHLHFLVHLMDALLPARLPPAKYMTDIFEYLNPFPSMGPFSAYQLLLCLSYTKFVNFHRDDFVMSGPGSISGLRKLFGDSWKVSDDNVVFHANVMRYLAQSQDYHFKRLGIKFSGLGPEKLPMDVSDIEHTLCEVDKYCRLAHPKLKGSGKRQQLTRLFKAAPSTPTYNPVILPKAWAHPQRRTPRPKDVDMEKMKRYVIDSIKEHGIDDKNERIFRLRWEGYGPKDDTWETQSHLMHECPTMITEYLSEMHLPSGVNVAKSRSHR